MKCANPLDFLSYFICPKCRSDKLDIEVESGCVNAVACKECATVFPVKEGNIVDFVLYDSLSELNNNEIKAMTFDLNKPGTVDYLTSKEDWNPMQTHFHFTAGLRFANQMLSEIVRDGDVLVSLGTGTGFELKYLPTERFSAVLASDIAASLCQVMPVTLKDKSGSLLTFASNFDQCPVKKQDSVVGVIYEALHHSGDIHASLRKLLEQNFDRLVIVEPTTNWLIPILAKYGLALNVEYSGLQPEWLDLKISAGIARELGYSFKVATYWPIPKSLTPKFIRNSTSLRGLVLKSADLISLLTRPFRFGAKSAVQFVKTNSL